MFLIAERSGWCNITVSCEFRAPYLIYMVFIYSCHYSVFCTKTEFKRLCYLKRSYFWQTNDRWQLKKGSKYRRVRLYNPLTSRSTHFFFPPPVRPSHLRGHPGKSTTTTWDKANGKGAISTTSLHPSPLLPACSLPCPLTCAINRGNDTL